MKVYVPSNGLLGTYFVEMKAPTLSVLNKVRDYSKYSLTRMSEFVRDTTNADLEKITLSDLQFLFMIGVASMTFNKFEYTIRCECGKIIKGAIDLTLVEPIRLSREEEYPAIVERDVAGGHYRFRYLSAKDFIDISEYTVDVLNDVDLDNKEEPQSAYQLIQEKALTSVCLFDSLDPKKVESVLDLPFTVVQMAIAFQEFYPHGLSLSDRVTCDKCKRDLLVNYPIDGSLLDFDMTKVIANHVALSKYLGYSDFMNFTLPEYSAYIDALNAHITKQNSNG